MRSDAVRPGGITVLAYPETIDLSAVECTRKSWVHSIFNHDIGKVIIKTPEGVAPVLESLESLEFLESTPRRFVPVANIDWMGTDFLSCSGATIKFFAQTSTKGITTDGLRYGVGVVLLLFSPRAVRSGLPCP